MQEKIIFGKVRLVYVVMLLFTSVLLLFTFRWQVVEADRFKEAAELRSKDDIIKGLRGTIYAADGSTLAYSEPRYDVYIWIPGMLFAERKGLQTRTEFTSKLAPLIDSSPEALNKLLENMIEQELAYPKVAESISVEVRDQIVALTRDKDELLPEDERGPLLGYDLDFTSTRIYPENRLASQVLGLTIKTEENDIIGISGLEGEWDGYLEPQEGFIQGERDAAGNAIGIASEKTIEAKRGSSVYISIDKKIQQVVEKELKKAVNKYKARSGSVIILDPKTGHILAMANFPDYDPNLREEQDPNVYGNQSLTEPYEIGSVGKVFTLSAALNSGLVTPESVVRQGHNGCEKIHEDLLPVCTYNKLPQPPMPIKEAFAKSDNLYFRKLAEIMWEEDKSLFYNYLDKFGLGKPTGINAKEDSFGYLKDWELWNIGDRSAYSYGHSYQANALQAIVGVATVANYGVRMQPQFVTKVVEADGKEIIYKPRVVEERVISKKTATQMDKMMHQIFLNNIFDGEYYYYHLEDYRIAMKSGTALIPYRNKAGYSSNINATYVGYDASPARTFAMLTRLEAPKFGTLASQNSRILWLEIFDKIKVHLGMPRKGES